MKAFFIGFGAALFLTGSSMAQTPIIVQPANQAAAPVQTANPQPSPGSDDIQATIKSLEEMKAANEEMLKKQQAVLDTLDQVQKEAEQLRIYAKRG
jgi:hypothetical protein